MRLFLSSYRAQGHEKELVELFGDGTETAVINNAKDYKTDVERQESVDDWFKYLSSLGFKPVELDLREYFGKPDKLEKELKKYQAVWVCGGNTFVLRRALRYSEADRVLRDMIRKNEIIYGGDSAGAIVVTPSLKGSEFGDEPNNVPQGYKPEIIWGGLDLIAYSIIPHYKSEGWGEFGDMMEEDLKKQKRGYKVLRDGQAIVINGDKEEFLE